MHFRVALEPSLQTPLTANRTSTGLVKLTLAPA